ncbi:hypothetical protein HL667_19955 [Bradyrhizobium sp. 83012]|uniref:Uncharacterized protein n=2 Tax=Bradyrhizobium aeschynomenes TaxID=2734909 RepID=A0ABX2CJ51_9BRAD|nr:hypothetical protein [Bradyrhizobium aeschynomenes]NPU11279.1 hypothetical protein [Bradyrhizobium aeschynomenes]NPU67287.1 hypothetical protein [Bradyrhizobium aeschynomenes]NPV21942.1 hypothetical protein [Bradyrhizobium aeschynomenes]
MSRWRRASVPKFSWVRGPGSGTSEHSEGPLTATANGFHDHVTLTLSADLTTVVAATIAAASTLSLGVSVSIVVLSIKAVISMPA